VFAGLFFVSAVRLGFVSLSVWACSLYCLLCYIEVFADSFLLSFLLT